MSLVQGCRGNLLRRLRHLSLQLTRSLGRCLQVSRRRSGDTALHGWRGRSHALVACVHTILKLLANRCDKGLEYERVDADRLAAGKAPERLHAFLFEEVLAEGAVASLCLVGCNILAQHWYLDLGWSLLQEDERIEASQIIIRHVSIVALIEKFFAEFDELGLSRAADDIDQLTHPLRRSNLGFLFLRQSFHEFLRAFHIFGLFNLLGILSFTMIGARLGFNW